MYYGVGGNSFTDAPLDSLEHHGILGQKWGVRRFQRADGTRTAAGKRREREGYDGETSTSSSGAHNGGSKVSIDRDKLIKGAAIAGTVAIGAALIANPGTRNVLTKYGKTAVSALTSDKAKEAYKKAGKAVGDSASRVGKSMLDAALVSVGAIGVNKIAQKYADQEGDSEATKNVKQVTRDALTAGVRSATGAIGGSSSGGNKGGSVGKEVSDKIGAPSNKGVDKQSAAYQNLFKGQDADTRATIKSLASAGYDVDQINKYLGHADFSDWASQYMAVEIGW